MVKQLIISVLYSKHFGDALLTALLLYFNFSPPLTQYFLECGSFAKETKNTAVSRNYLSLINELWSRKRCSMNLLLFF